MIMKRNNIFRVKNIIVFFLTLTFLSCKKFVEIDPPVTSTNTEIVYGSDATAIAVLTGIYTKMSQSGINNGLTAMSLFPSLSADELDLYDGVNDPAYIGFYKNSLTSSIVGGATDFWSNIYSIIFTANSAIEGLANSSTLTPLVKQRLMGEAKFIRGFCYFYLVNLYGDVPLVLTTDYRTNSTISRMKKELIYAQIVSDLKDAKEMLSSDYVDGTLLGVSNARISPNKWAASALLARTYLYMKDYANADRESTAVIATSSLYETVDLENVFKSSGNREAIWQIQSVDNFLTNTSDAWLYVLPEQGPDLFGHQVFLSERFKDELLSSDKRRQQWIGEVNVKISEANGSNPAIYKKYYFPHKYKNNAPFSEVTEATVVLRLAEQYLIRAECRLKLGDFAGARNDINKTRMRAGFSGSDAGDELSLMNQIIYERKAEFFTEWGHRWLDLKRLGIANNVLSPIKGVNWQSTDELYPIPQSDMDRNPGLKGNQNPGY